MRKFILTKLNIDNMSLEDTKDILDKISELDFSIVFLSLNYREYKKYKNTLRELSNEYADRLDIAIRIDIDESKRNKIKNILTVIRKNVDIISITPTNRETASFVCRDGRIDIVAVTQNNFKLFSDSMLRLCRENNKTIEFNLFDLLHTWGSKRVGILGKLRTVAKRTHRLHVKFIVTLSPRTFYDLRKPSEIIFIGRTLGFSIDLIKDSISIIPLELLKNNREKRGRNFILPGVKIVKHPKEE